MSLLSLCDVRCACWVIIVFFLSLNVTRTLRDHLFVVLEDFGDLQIDQEWLYFISGY